MINLLLDGSNETFKSLSNEVNFKDNDSANKLGAIISIDFSFVIATLIYRIYFKLTNIFI